MKAFLKSNTLFFLLLLPLTAIFIKNYHFNSYILGGDMDGPELNPSYNLYSSLFTWFDYQGTGVNSGLALGRVSYYLFTYILSIFGLNYIHIKWLLTYILFLLPYFSMYFVLQRLNKNKLLNLSISLFYLINIFTLITFYSPNYFIRILQTIFPIVFFLLYRGLDTLRFKYLLALNLLLVLSSVIFVNFGYLLPLLVFIVIFALGYTFLLFSKKRLIYLIILVVTFCLTVSVWVLPSVISYSTGSSLSDSVSQKDYTDSTIVFSSKQSNLINVFALIGPGLWGEKNQKIFGGQFFSFYSLLNSHFYSAILFIPLLVIFMLVFTRNYGTKSDTEKIKIFFVLLLAGVFLGKSINDPFSNLSKWLFNYMPGFVIFRDPYAKIGYFLLGVYSLLLFYLLKNQKQKIFIFLLLFYSLLLSVPLMKGQMIWSKNYSQMPTEYIETAEIINKDIGNFRVLELPYPKFMQILKKYGNYYYGTGIWQYILGHPTMDSSFNWGNEFNEGFTYFINVLTSKDLTVQDINFFNYLSKVYRLKYIILNKSVDVSNNSSEKILAGSKSVFIKGDIELHENDIEDSLVYVPQKVYISKEPITYTKYQQLFETFSNFSKSINYNENAILLSPISPEGNYFPNDLKVIANNYDEYKYNEGLDKIKVSFSKISPVKYKAHLENVQNITYIPLMLDQSFNTYWVVKPNSSYHSVGNLYSNFWLIQNPNGSDTLDLEIYYTFQNVFYTGIILSITGILLCVTLTFYDRKGKLL